jgi:hypothetical protein
MYNVMLNSLPVLVLLYLLVIMTGCGRDNAEVADYPIRPVPFTSVKLTDKFWSQRIKKNADVTIPIAFSYCESTGRIRNFEIAGGLDTGSFKSLYPFDDSDVFKIIEGASYSLQTYPDPILDEYLDTLIYKIGLAQEDDGYLYTNRTIAEMHGGAGLHEWANEKKWLNDSLHSHELYNIGHLYEAAVAHYQATGKRTLLDVAVRSADLVFNDFGYDKLKVWPGHQVIEMGLVKLFCATGDRRYLDLARFFLDIRGPDGRQYNQAIRRPVDQTEAEGHAVRATYMYSGMADIAAMTKDDAYLKAISSIWEDIVYRKMYITGGIGATGGNEGFAEAYFLPNMSAYCETCASIGNIFTNNRLFLLYGESKYVDILEKTLYNSMLSGVSLTGDRFFYPNPLESSGQHQRSPWFGCACCPSNIARFIPAIPGYIYAVTDRDLYINMYISNEADIQIGDQKVKISQTSGFPRDGKVQIIVGTGHKAKFIMKLRIPGWAVNEAIPGDLYRFEGQNPEEFSLLLNGDTVITEIRDGYVSIDRIWNSGDKLQLLLPMPVRLVTADDRIKDNNGKVAVQRGPVIYCAEWPDNNKGNVLNLVLKRDSGFTTHYSADLLGGTQVIKARGCQTVRTVDGGIRMLDEETITLIPYALWNNRGPGQMMVWLPVTPEAAKPLPAPSIAFKSRVKASRMTGDLPALNDQLEPQSSNDRSIPYFHWWPEKNKWVYVQYDFPVNQVISGTKVYWYDDTPEGGCRVPDEWEILYLSGNMWKPVKPWNPYRITKNSWDTLKFQPVRASAVKLKVKLNKSYSAGLYEWVVK